MDVLLGVVGIILDSDYDDYGSFPHSLLSTSKLKKFTVLEA